MNVIKTFEQRMDEAFGAAPQGFIAPISFKKLAKRAAREMENETFVVNGVDTAPALYTILVASPDDAAMRPLYPQITTEIADFVEAEGKRRGYSFVGRPLARFMVDPSLHSGKFAVFAENVDALTLNRLRQEEEAFLSGASMVGGAASTPAPAAFNAQKNPDQRHASTYTPPAIPFNQQSSNLRDIPVMDPAQITAPSPLSDDSRGLGVIPTDYVDSQYADVISQPAPQQAAQNVPVTQRRPVAVRRTEQAASPATQAPATCRLIDHQSGRVYMATSPTAIIGRERTPGGVVLRDPNVSRQHAELSFDGRSWHIRDLQSTNGTLVNDVDIHECALRDGDLITVGLMNLEFRES
ncbi:MAG: DUF3662 and FHA domain-containing protein [Olegusella sp.]|jgi:hypothetical protein|nr:DUF3662 and FHA domain-containing protein [Olegusella sp.]MCI1933610.1 DUF3662 and FHA domain-containing protein [Atopobiaceae bacterium]NLH91515.1 DUF3662 and FHA domain-containing protein [Atopobium sp.]